MNTVQVLSIYNLVMSLNAVQNHFVLPIDFSHILQGLSPASELEYIIFGKLQCIPPSSLYQDSIWKTVWNGMNPAGHYGMISKPGGIFRCRLSCIYAYTYFRVYRTRSAHATESSLFSMKFLPLNTNIPSLIYIRFGTKDTLLILILMER